MVTTHGKVTNYRQSHVAVMHSLLRELELLRINTILPENERAAKRESIETELLRTQKNLDEAPNDRDALKGEGSIGEKRG